MSWNAYSVKAQPLWQLLHCALPVNSRNPAASSAVNAASSPPTQRSNRVDGDTSVRSNTATALARVCGLARGSSGKAARKASAYDRSAARSATTEATGRPISSGASIGPATCSSRLRARPSQNTGAAQARFHRVGVWRLSGMSETPRPCRRPSAKPFAPSWQVAQAIAPLADRRLSWNRRSPSARFASEKGFDAGNGTAAGQRNAAFKVGKSGSCPAPSRPNAWAPSPSTAPAAAPARNAIATRRGADPNDDLTLSHQLAGGEF